MIQEFIKLYLKINPEPSDAQVHALAWSLGTDPQTLEAIIYKMLGRCVTVQAAARLIAATEFEQTLLDEIEPEDLRDNLTTVNDGEEPASSIQEMQDILRDDGGLVPDQVQNLTRDDGAL